MGIQADMTVCRSHAPPALDASLAGNPLVSVVIAVHGGANDEDLRSALLSILSQSYHPIEAIVVVDGPIDDHKSTFLAEFAALENWRIITLPQNRGPAGARNAGILAASGEYIAIMDADDVSHSERVAVQKAHLESEGLDVVSSPMDVIDARGEIIGARLLPSSAESVRRWAPYGCPLNNPAVFAKAGVLKANIYDERYRVSEDYELWVRLLLSGHKLGNTTERTVLYRQPNEAYAKRRGLTYAWADARVKIAATRLVAWPRKPGVVLFALTSACIRLLPGALFRVLYRLKATWYARLLRRRAPGDSESTGRVA